MISLKLGENANISINSFMGYVLNKTDWQQWVQSQGEKLDEKSSMIITFESPTSVKVESRVGDVIGTNYLDWQEIREGSKQEKSDFWMKQWSQLDKMIKDFVGG